MVDRRERGAPVGSMSSPRPRQRFRPCTRQDMLKKMRAAAAVLMVLSVVTTTAVQGFVLVNPNLRALSMYILVVLLVSAALRSILVTNFLAPIYNRSLDTTAVYGTYLLVVLLVSAALRSALVTNSLASTYNRSLDTTAVYGTYL